MGVIAVEVSFHPRTLPHLAKGELAQPPDFPHRRPVAGALEQEHPLAIAGRAQDPGAGELGGHLGRVLRMRHRREGGKERGATLGQPVNVPAHPLRQLAGIARRLGSAILRRHRPTHRDTDAQTPMPEHLPRQQQGGERLGEHRHTVERDRVVPADVHRQHRGAGLAHEADERG